MSHSVKVTLIADQEIRLFGKTVNVHMINSIRLEDEKVVSYCIKDSRTDVGYTWVYPDDMTYIPQTLQEYEDVISGGPNNVHFQMDEDSDYTLCGRSVQGANIAKNTWNATCHECKSRSDL